MEVFKISRYPGLQVESILSKLNLVQCLEKFYFLPGIYETLYDYEPLLHLKIATTYISTMAFHNTYIRIINIL
jgi:hypothetical protein